MKIRLLFVLFLLSVISFPQNLFSYDSGFEGTTMSDQDVKKFSATEVKPTEEQVGGNSKVVRTPGNFVYRIAPDRPIEKYTSYEGPITMDSYMYMKFKEQEKIMQEMLDKRFTQMDFRLGDLENSLADIKFLLSKFPTSAPQGSQQETSQPASPPQEISKLL